MENDSSLERRCPGTKYKLSQAVCKGRQRVNYPKCMVCGYRENADKVIDEPVVNINSGIFKSYDIRGLFPSELNEHAAQKIGESFGKFIKDENSAARNIVVGRDMRSSSLSLRNSLIEGITSMGLDVINIGVVSTDGVYFAVGNYKFDAGVMITASHNPAKYNGFKLCREKVIPISSDTGLEAIARLVKTPVIQTSAKPGSTIEKEIFIDYRKFALNFLSKRLRPLRIVVDAGNGMAGKIVPIVFDKNVCEIVPMYFKLDGNFPNHEPNPLLQKNLVDLQKKVVETKANFGVAFDGDADRCVFVDEKGGIVGGDMITTIIAKEFLMKKKGETIIYDLRSSKATHDEIKSAGGTPVRERVGHSHIKATMREKEAVFAGELSGHYYYRDNFYADSGIITLIQIINIISKKNIPLSKIVEPFKRYHATGEINFEVDNKDARIEQLASIFSDGKIDYLDGITVEYNDWWFNVRKSNTEPILRLNLEAKSQKLLLEKTKSVTKAINEGAPAL